MLNRLRILPRRLHGLWWTAPGTCVIALACLFVFAVQCVSSRVEFISSVSFDHPFTYLFSLHLPLVAEGFFWQPATYAFLHGSSFHLAVNLVGLLVFGTALERELRTGIFLRTFFLGSIIGGIVWALLDYAAPFIARFIEAGLPHGETLIRLLHITPVSQPGVCMGASAGLFALMGLYAVVFANRKLLVLLYFVLPLKMRARTMGYAILALTVADALFAYSNTAYTAHLGGFFTGAWLGLQLRHKGYGDER